MNKLLSWVKSTDPLYQSLIDVDFYKFTMGHFIWKNYPDVNVTFRLINRDKKIPLARVVNEDELRRELDHVRTLSHDETNLAYLLGMRVYGKNMFADEYRDFLAGLRLPPYELTRAGDQYELAFSGKYSEVTYWETIALAIISALYYRTLLRMMQPYEIEALFAGGLTKLYEKLRLIKMHPDIRFADFSQRRRMNFLWQKKAVGMAKDVLGGQFTGTSNTWMAMHYNLVPVGTNAHELPMVLTALEDTPEGMRAAQYRLLSEWQAMYGAGLRVCLPDTYVTQEFLKQAPDWLAKEWRGFRQDSGDPIAFGERVIGWYYKHKVNPMKEGKLIIFSDGLDVNQMIRISGYFKDQINVAFGWGTLFANDFIGCHPNRDEAVPEFGMTWGELFRPFSLVCKVSEANGRPAVKLSDNIAKATGPKDEVARYAKIFGRDGRVNEPVVV